MAQLTIELSDADYQRQEQIRQFLPELEETFDVTQGPVYQMEGYDSEAPDDLSVNLDKYLYGVSEMKSRLSEVQGKVFEETREFKGKGPLKDLALQD